MSSSLICPRVFPLVLCTMVICCIVGCSVQSKTSQGVSYFSIPKVKCHQSESVFQVTARRRSLWISRINRKDLTEKDITSCTKVCSRHFLNGKPAYEMMETDPDWAPCLYLGYKSVSAENSVKNVERSKRRTERKRKLEVLTEVVDNQQNVQPDIDVQEPPKFRDACVQTDMSVELVDKLQNIAMAACFMEESLKDDDYKVKYYTGLPSFNILKAVFVMVSKHIELCSRTALTQFQEFCLVLMRLRLALQEEDLSYRFAVHQTTVSRIIDRWLPIMSHVLSNFIIWPDRETLRMTMPECFLEAFGRNITVIIDCFEIFCERPSNLLPRAQTFSNYKHHNTVKVLIGITPQGTVSFVSLAWGGRTSDKKMVEGSGFLDMLVPGDVILADRGFDIADSVGFLRARVLIPAFKGQGRNQLSADEIEMSREIAHVRIHVERVIGLVRRKFKILESNLHYSWTQIAKGEAVPRIDHALKICCALSNLCPPIVPLTSTSDIDDLEIW